MNLKKILKWSDCVKIVHQGSDPGDLCIHTIIIEMLQKVEGQGCNLSSLSSVQFNYTSNFCFRKRMWASPCMHVSHRVTAYYYLYLAK